MKTREMLIESIDKNNLTYYSISSGRSPYSKEFIIILSKEDDAKLHLYRGLVRLQHKLCVISGLKFDGHKLAIKELETVRWTRPGYEGRGHNVVPYRIVLDTCPNDTYKLFTEVSDLGTAKAAEEAGYAAIVLQGCEGYETVYLVEDGFMAKQVMDLE